MKIYLTLTAAILLAVGTYSQGKIKSDEVSDIKKRTLLVELLEFDSEIQAKFQKQLSKAKKPEAKSKIEERKKGNL